MEMEMFRMDFRELPNSICVRIEGRFVGDFAEHARLLIAHSKTPSRFVADLSEVTYVDSVGEEVLTWFKEIGVRFTADSAYSRDVCDRLQLPIAGEESKRSRHHRDSARKHSQRASATCGTEAFVAGAADAAS